MRFARKIFLSKKKAHHFCVSNIEYIMNILFASLFVFAVRGQMVRDRKIFRLLRVRREMRYCDLQRGRK